MSNIRRELRTNGAAEFEGVMLKYAGEWGDLKPGDTYIAERNTGPHLLTVREVRTDPGTGWVISVENAYPYDLGECVKVEMMED